jgi:hypothetical protein
MGPRAGLDGCGKSGPPTGIRSPDRPARSESLYRLSYAGSVRGRDIRLNVVLHIRPADQLVITAVAFCQSTLASTALRPGDCSMCHKGLTHAEIYSLPTDYYIYVLCRNIHSAYRLLHLCALQKYTLCLQITSMCFAEIYTLPTDYIYVLCVDLLTEGNQCPSFPQSFPLCLILVLFANGHRDMA